MKKVALIIGLIGFVFCGVAHAQEWHTANQVTVTWDPVTQNEQGTALPTGSIVKYNVYFSNALTDPGKTNPALVMEEITENITTLTLSQGRFFAGVRALLFVENMNIGESDISWSDDPQSADNPFGVQYFIAPGRVGGLKTVP